VAGHLRLPSAVNSTRTKVLTARLPWTTMTGSGKFRSGRTITSQVGDGPGAVQIGGFARTYQRTLRDADRPGRPSELNAGLPTCIFMHRNPAPRIPAHAAYRGDVPAPRRSWLRCPAARSLTCPAPCLGSNPKPSSMAPACPGAMSQDRFALSSARQGARRSQGQKSASRPAGPALRALDWPAIILRQRKG
jgi:hypothetical protein